jgi:hypothetical protein
MTTDWVRSDRPVQHRAVKPTSKPVCGPGKPERCSFCIAEVRPRQSGAAAATLGSRDGEGCLAPSTELDLSPSRIARIRKIVRPR